MRLFPAIDGVLGIAEGVESALSARALTGVPCWATLGNERFERVLGNQVHNVRPRWAKGTAHRVARLLSDHIEELERRDALLGDGFPSSQGGHHG